jgi:UDP-glucose 4-epimerase
LQRGHRAIVLGKPAGVPPGQGSPNRQLLTCRPGKPQHIEVVFSSHKIDAVVHLAAEALVGKSSLEPSTPYTANVAKGVHLLDAMVRHGMNKLIFSSTVATNGTANTVPITEKHLTAPISPYAKSRLIF